MVRRFNVMMDSNNAGSSSNNLLNIEEANNSNDRYNTYMREVKEIHLSDFVPPKDIEHTESPFRWVQVLKTENFASGDYLVKMEDYLNQGDSYTFEKFLPYMVLTFEYSLLKNFEESKFFIKKMRDLLRSMENENGSLYQRIKNALQHVFVATAANIFILADDNSDEAKDLKATCSNLEPLSEMDSVQQAAILAIKSKFYLSCTTETNLALTFMKEASTLDPNCATWKYWTGKILRKIRRDNREPSDLTEELTYFEEAVTQDRDAKHLVFLAQAYREKACNLQRYKQLRLGSAKEDLWKDIDFLNEQSYNLYMECAELNPSSAAIYRRIGNGLMSLPKQFANYNLAKQFLHKAEQYSNNPITFHILGTFYSRHEPNPDKALEYFQKSVRLGYLTYGYGEIMRIKYVKDPNYDPLEDLKKAEKALKYSSKLEIIENDIGWCYLIFQNDLQKGLEYFWKMIERDEHSALLKRSYSYPLLIKGPVNIYKLLQEKILNTAEESRNELMVKFLEKVNSNPQLLDNCDTCVSWDKALREASSTLNWERRRLDKIKLSQEKSGKNSTQDKKYPAYKNGKKYLVANETALPTFNANERETPVYRAPKMDNRESYHKETNWRNTSVGGNSSTPDREKWRTSASRAPSEQENWRLQCPKF